MLTINNISVSYGSILALQNVSLEISDAQIWALTGPNGAGKTTLLKTIAGLLQPIEGGIFWGSSSAKENLQQFKQEVHYVPQKADLYPNLTVYETLLFFARLRGEGKWENIFQQFHLEELKDRRLKSLSGGQRQRVVVAQAFLGSGKCLLLDEPTANLDAETVFQLKEQLKHFAQEGGTVIFSSHIVDDIQDGLVDHQVVMDHGTIQKIS